MQPYTEIFWVKGMENCSLFGPQSARCGLNGAKCIWPLGRCVFMIQGSLGLRSKGIKGVSSFALLNRSKSEMYEWS